MNEPKSRRDTENLSLLPFEEVEEAAVDKAFRPLASQPSSGASFFTSKTFRMTATIGTLLTLLIGGSTLVYGQMHAKSGGPLVGNRAYSTAKEFQKNADGGGEAVLGNLMNPKTIDGSAPRLKSFPASREKINFDLENSFEFIGPSKEYDRGFLKTWWRFVRELWTANGKENGIKEALPTSAVAMVPWDNEILYRKSQLTAHWMSPDCNFLDLKLKLVRSLQEDRKNEVSLMRDEDTDKLYVIKTFTNPDHFYSELIFSTFLDRNNPYFAKAVCHRREKVSKSEMKGRIIFEFAGKMESDDYARTASYDKVKVMAAQLLLAIEHMHYLKFIHADLKPENVLVDEGGNIKMIDFGFTSALPYGKTTQGTHTTMAPELHSKVPGSVHEGIDWWAYGSTVAIWFGNHFNEKRRVEGKSSNDKFVAFDWKKTYFEAGRVPEGFPADLRSFLYLFFSVDPDARKFNTPRLLKMLRSHEFFKDIKWSELHGGDFGALYP